MQHALDALTTLGQFAVGLALLLGSMGIPVPASLMVLAAGAFVREGRLSGIVAFLCAVAGATLGNTISYHIGKYGLKGFIERLKKGESWRKAEKTFKERGALAVFLTRFLLTPLALPTNLIAGGEGFPLPKFLAACVAGEITYLLLYGGLGYAFADQWKTVAIQASRFSHWIILAVALFAGYRFWLYRREKAKTKATKAETGTEVSASEGVTLQSSAR